MEELSLEDRLNCTIELCGDSILKRLGIYVMRVEINAAIYFTFGNLLFLKGVYCFQTSNNKFLNNPPDHKHDTSHFSFPKKTAFE